MQAWKQWRNQTPLEIMDPILKEACSQSEVIKCIQLGLLCIQENPDDRPTMAQVVSYLSSLLVELPLPQEPPASSMDRGIKLNITTKESSSAQFISHSNSTSSSINDMTKSQFFPR
jgi:hypothetical protein